MAQELRQLHEQNFCGWCGSKVTYPSQWMSVCNGCGYKNYLTPRPCCNIVIKKNGRLMMAERAVDPGKGKMDFPGGFMDMTDDSIEAAAYRELLEEFRLTREMVSPLRYAESSVAQYPWCDSAVPCACFYFTCDLLVDEIDPAGIDQSENSRLRWVRLADAVTIDFAWDNDKQMFEKFFNE